MRKILAHNSSSGQVLLVVVVVMVVALTVGLSVASRTITNLKLSKQNEDSQKAFQAASAGIDRYINAAEGDPASQSLLSSSFDTKITDVRGNTIVLNNNEVVDQDRGIDVWLSSYPNYSNQYQGNVQVFWGTTAQNQCTTGAGASTRPAVEIIILSGSVANPTLAKYAYDACSRGNNFVLPPAGALSVSGVNFSQGSASYTFSAANPGIIMKVIPLYNSAKVAVFFQPSLGQAPVQGKLIESVGTSGDTKRKIVYYESYPQIPNEIFPYAILSQ